MSQSYIPASRKQPASSTPEKEVVAAAFAQSHASDIVARAEGVQDAYIEQKNKLVFGIDATVMLLDEIRAFNKESWVVRYPQLNPAQTQDGESAPTMRRSLSYADEPQTATEVVISKGKNGMQRSVSLANMAEAQEQAGEDADAPSDFSVLRLDLKLGPTGSSTSPAALVSQLEKASIASLVDERIQTSLKHISKLRTRVEDTSSKVLVTGDLNAGKSTFVNALLRKEIMPVDQQPCTTLFCEVHDAADNFGKEEAHLLRDGVGYSVKDTSTYIRHPLSDLEKIVTDSDVQHKLKVYIGDNRTESESLLHNGVVDISLIDAPGLNRDSLKTTANFARQEEIDVVVFVVSAENHFTLSAREFLSTASNEKAYLFIVVNRFDQIRDKERCKRLVLEQIKQLSPRTWDDAEDLVHFVDSSASVDPSSPASPSFDKLESALRSFVLVKRSKSKLLPASTYLTKLLSDVDLLASANSIVAQAERDQAIMDLERVRPVLEQMKSGREVLEDSLECVEDERTSQAGASTRAILTDALARVGEGELALTKGLAMPTYPGVLRVWEYVQDVRRTLLASIDLAVKLAEDEARGVTTTGVRDVAILAEQHLPVGVERSKRVFMPEAMFSPRARPGKARAGSNKRVVVVAGGTYGLGIGLAQRPELLETSFADLFDVQHYVSLHFGKEKHANAQEEEAAFSALSMVSFGVGALTMAGGKALGARGLLEALVRVSDLLGNPRARRWVAPVLGTVTLALAAYFVVELPSTVPRTVGRRIRAELIKAGADGEDFQALHAARVERETRKVLRLASWDLRERFRGAMEERAREVRGAEEMQARAEKAHAWFTEVVERTMTVREFAGLGMPEL